MPTPMDIQVWDCSPRAGGHSQAIQAMLGEALRQKGMRPKFVTLREYQVWPCQGCQRCSGGKPCLLADADACEHLFSLLFAARAVCFVAPIYFYHLPASFKALIDRSQSVYARFEGTHQKDRSAEQRQGSFAFGLLHAGRGRGERLFAGSIVTLRFFLRSFGLPLDGVHTIRGMDEVQHKGWPDALLQSTQTLAESMAESPKNA
ncbi:MAG: flavodoxin family protein [Thermodesulfobacteriota bacterium]